MGWRLKYILLVEYVCNCCYVVDSPKNSAAVVGFSHKSIGCRVGGFAGQLKGYTVWYRIYDSLHAGQQSKVLGMILAL